MVLNEKDSSEVAWQNSQLCQTQNQNCDLHPKLPLTLSWLVFMAWNVSPFLHIWVVDSSFFSCFRKTTRLTLVQNCHQSSVGCSIDFRLANIILERLKLAWSKENQTGKNGGKDLAKHSFTQATDTGGWLNTAGLSHCCIWQRGCLFIFLSFVSSIDVPQTREAHC